MVHRSKLAQAGIVAMIFIILIVAADVAGVIYLDNLHSFVYQEQVLSEERAMLSAKEGINLTEAGGVLYVTNTGSVTSTIGYVIESYGMLSPPNTTRAFVVDELLTPSQTLSLRVSPDYLFYTVVTKYGSSFTQAAPDILWAFGTASYQNAPTWWYGTVKSFPSSVQALDSPADCSLGYQGVGYTAVGFVRFVAPTVQVLDQSYQGVALFYAPLSGVGAWKWQSAFGPSAWEKNTGKPYNTTLSVVTGETYEVVVQWFGACGNGLSELEVIGAYSATSVFTVSAWKWNSSVPAYDAIVEAPNQSPAGSLLIATGTWPSFSP